MTDQAFRTSIYCTGFVLGFVLMGFEILGSRFLDPYFGSGVFTWAALISVTLFSLMVGYFIGGRLVDRFPNTRLLGVLVLFAGLSMGLIGLPIGGFDAPMNQWQFLGRELMFMMSGHVDFGPSGVTAAAFVLLFVPITLIACFSPFAVRLLLVSTNASGRQTGTVYGVSTFGNILGTWATAFWLIPSIGTSVITWIFTGITLVCGVFLIMLKGPNQ